MSLDPPLPVYLFNLVAGLRDKSAKGYPIKKVHNAGTFPRGEQLLTSLQQLLLVLWKTLLACWGGIKDHERVKKIARELHGLPNQEGSKSSPA